MIWSAGAAHSIAAVGEGLGITEKSSKNPSSKEIAALWAEIVAGTVGVLQQKEAAQ